MKEACPCCGWRSSDKAPFAVNLDANSLSYAGKSVDLTPTEAELAYVLAKAWPQPAHRTRIETYVWPQGDAAQTSVRLYVKKLRRKLSHVGLEIVTTHSFGYAIKAG